MTIEYINELPADESKRDREGKQGTRREFEIKTPHTMAPVKDSELMLDEIFRVRPELQPSISHPSNKTIFVTEPVLKRQSRWLWKLTVPYAEGDIQEMQAQAIDDPAARPAKINIGGWNEQRIITEGVSGKPLQNTAGDPFPDVEDVYESLEISVQKDVRAIRPEWLLDYPNSINAEEMKFLNVRFPAQTLLMTEPSASNEESDRGFRFYPFGYKLIFRRDGWKKRLLNTGLRERELIILPVTREQVWRMVPIRDHLGEPVSEPVFLDKKGRAYRVGVDPEKELFSLSDYKQPLRTDLKPEEIITLEFDVKRVLPFKKLPYR